MAKKRTELLFEDVMPIYLEVDKPAGVDGIREAANTIYPFPDATFGSAVRTRIRLNVGGRSARTLARMR